jgi:Na+-transporting methylmalonyl-CoA/oxaloacetate decarboxylase gamma subunit
MWKFATSIKTIIGLSALSLLIAYLLTDKMIESGIIETTFGLGMLFVFLFIFVVSNLILVIISKEKQNKTIDTLKQNVKSGNSNEQKMKVAKNAKDNIQGEQTVSLGDKNKQNIDIS